MIKIKRETNKGAIFVFNATAERRFWRGKRWNKKDSNTLKNIGVQPRMINKIKPLIVWKIKKEVVMAKRSKGHKVAKPKKIEDIDTGKRYVWVLVEFSDSNVYKIPAEMFVDIQLAKEGRPRDLDKKNEMLSSKSTVKGIADSLDWVDVKMRAYLYDGKIQNAVANQDTEWKQAKKWVEEDLNVRHV